MGDHSITQSHLLAADPMTLLFVGIGFCIFLLVFGLLMFFSESSRNKTNGRKLVPIPRPFEGGNVQRTQVTLADSKVQRPT